MKAQLARAPRRHPRPSASAAPELTIQAESLYDISAELPSLLVRYGRESAKAPVDPDWQGMLRMTAEGKLKVVTARYNGALIGFAFSIVGSHLMYKSTMHGITVAVWVDKIYRATGAGLRLLRMNRDLLLDEWGCKRACIARDAAGDKTLGKVYERLGYKLDELSYARGV